MAAVFCKICRSDQTEFLFEKNGFDLYSCAQCRVVFAYNELSQSQLEELLGSLYSEPYFSLQKEPQHGNLGYQTDYFSQKKEEKYRFAARMLKQIDRIKPRMGRMLDVGCAAGFFLHAAKQRGWQTVGIELSQIAAAFARDQFGLEVVVGTLETTGLGSASFDVITAWDVIEHVTDPQKFVQAAARLLKHDGILVLGTPNAGALAARLRGKAWKIYKPPEHLFYFNPGSLRYLLKPYFEILKIEYSPAPPTRIYGSLFKKAKYAAYRIFDAAATFLQHSEYLVACASFPELTKRIDAEFTAESKTRNRD